MATAGSGGSPHRRRLLVSTVKRTSVVIDAVSERPGSAPEVPRRAAFLGEGEGLVLPRSLLCSLVAVGVGFPVVGASARGAVTVEMPTEITVSPVSGCGDPTTPTSRPYGPW